MVAEIKHQPSDIHQTLQKVRDVDINSNEFFAILSLISHKIDQAREAHPKGYLPKRVWNEQVRLAGSYPCTEILLISPSGYPVLKVRQTDDASRGEKVWEGNLHIPGQTKLKKLRGEKILSTLINDEIVKDSTKTPGLLRKGKIAGFGIYPEPERNTDADTVIYAIHLDEDEMSDLQPGFFEITPEIQKSGLVLEGKKINIIDQHVPVIEWWFIGKTDLLYSTLETNSVIIEL